jgi:hypothetical protein
MLPRASLSALEAVKAEAKLMALAPVPPPRSRFTHYTGLHHCFVLLRSPNQLLFGFFLFKYIWRMILFYELYLEELLER